MISKLTNVSAAVTPSSAEPFYRRVLVVGGAAVAVLMAVSGRYGFHRDELYFMACAQHLQASYVDQPVLTPLLAWVSLKAFGVSLPGLRVWPALATGATVVVGGLTAREFGGGRRAQLLAAVGAATMPAVLAAGHVLGTTAFDILAWAGLALVAARIGRTGDVRWWLAGGVVLGLGLANKHSAGFFAVALVIGTVASGGRRLVWNRWFAAGAVAIDGWLAARRSRMSRLLLATGLTTALTLPFVLPVLPTSDIGPTAKVNTVLAESIGWPQLVATVRTAWAALPPARRANAVIFASNYGEASAINILGRGTGLPQAVSGHNTYWWWGPGNPYATTVLAVLPGPVDDDGGGAAYLRQFFTSVRAVATLSNPYGLRNQEFGGHVYLCTGPRHPWGQMWPQLRSYS